MVGIGETTMDYVRVCDVDQNIKATRRYERIKDSTTSCGSARERQSVPEIPIALMYVLQKLC